jgi:hypothetical protein
MSDGTFLQVTVFPDRTEAEILSLLLNCEGSDAVSIENFKERIQLATVVLEREAGIAWRPATFLLMASQESGCASSAGYPITLVDVFGEGRDRYTVEFSPEHPGGIVCENDNADGCAG